MGGGASIITPTGESLSPQERHQLRHRELFLSRQIETLPATHIRGKCTVTLLNETELLLAYLNKDVSVCVCVSVFSMGEDVHASLLIQSSTV